MAARLVVSSANRDTPVVGGLFHGLCFFLVQRLPQRSTFVERIQANDGRVVKIETQADHVIADHYRHDCPVGSISYTFIEKALEDGALPKPEEHSAGPPPGSVREVGSGAPSKATRTPFSIEDDKELWQWVERCKAGGALIKGNEIYKQLELKNPRHPYQAWRDRYLKRLMDKPPAGVEVTVAANAPPSPPTAQDAEQEVTAVPANETPAAEQPVEEEGDKEEAQVEDAKVEPDFTEEDLENLLQNADDIEIVHVSLIDDAWESYAMEFPDHSAKSWRAYWEDCARPVYLARELEAARRRKRKAAQIDVAQNTPELPSNNDNQGNADDDGEVEVRPSSSRSRKRKLETPTVANTTSLRKKQKSDRGDENHGETEVEELPTIDAGHPAKQPPARPSTQIIEILSGNEEEEQPATDSELTGAAQRQLHEDGNRASDDVIPTSELNRDAQAQFDEEVLGIAPASLPQNNSFMSNIPSSEINHAADQQVRRESLSLQDAIEEDPSVSESSDQSSSTSNILQQRQVIDEAATDLLAPEGNALTEANLASQQAEHKEQLLRGQDLPEDDDVRDGTQQDEYVKFLQSMPRPSVVAFPPAAKVQREVQPEEPELPSNTMPITYLPLIPNGVDEILPMSSQQVIDEAMDDIIQWPQSPVGSQRKALVETAGQDGMLERQVEYPSLPEEAMGIALEADDSVFSGQPSFMEHEAVAYPQLPEELAAEDAVTTSWSARASSGVELSEDEGESSYVVVNDEEGFDQGHPRYVQDGFVDPSMPEPEDGWDESSSSVERPSSQLVPQSVSPAKTTLVPRQATEPEDVGEIVEVAAQEVVDLSSASSSSSSSSLSEDGQDAAAAVQDPRANGTRALETQDILDAETQLPDFEMPLPPDSDPVFEGELPSDPLDQPSSPPPTPNARHSQKNLAHTQQLSREDGDIEDYISTLQTLHKYSELSIISALKCTSMRPDLTELVLLEETAGKGLPRDVAGIWDEREDEVLESGDARGIKDLEKKHGWEECRLRMDFLEEWREMEVDEDLAQG